MTELLIRPRSVDLGPPAPAGRPLWLTSGLAGLVAALVGLAVCGAVALAGWYAADGGGHGDTRDALRVAADAWLLGHGAGLRLSEAEVTAIPLGISVLGLLLARGCARHVARRSAVEDPASACQALLILTSAYAVVAMLTGVLAGVPEAEPSLMRSLLGAVVVASLGGAAGLLGSSPVGRQLADRTPAAALAVARGAAALTLGMLTLGAVLVAGMLLLHLGAAANVLSHLGADAGDGALATVAVAAVAPNASLLAGSYLLGPGFAVGSGTLVSPVAVVLGPLPAFPLLAALPSDGAGREWATGLVAGPVLLAALVGAANARRHPAFGYEQAALRGLGAGLVGGVVTTGLMLLAGGSVGPGRMRHLGPPALELLVTAPVALGVGAMVGALAGTWWLRRIGPGRRAAAG